MPAIYHVKTPTGDRLIRAGTKAVAINHAMRGMIEAKAVTATDMADLMASGVAIEDASRTAEEATSKTQKERKAA